MAKKTLLAALEEMAQAAQINDTDPNVEKDPLDPNAKGEVENVIAAEDNGSMPVNNTTGLIENQPDTPQPTGPVEEIGDKMVEKGKETESGIQVLAQEEQEQIMVDIGNATEAADELEKYRDIVADAAAKNDLTGVGAEILSTALESLYERYNIPTFGRSVPSLESFVTPVGRARSASTSLSDMDRKLSGLRVAIEDMRKRLPTQ